MGEKRREEACVFIDVSVCVFNAAVVSDFMLEERELGR